MPSTTSSSSPASINFPAVAFQQSATNTYDDRTSAPSSPSDGAGDLDKQLEFLTRAIADQTRARLLPDDEENLTVNLLAGSFVLSKTAARIRNAYSQLKDSKPQDEVEWWDRFGEISRVVLERLYRAEFRSEEEVEEVRDRLQTAVDQAISEDQRNRPPFSTPGERQACISEWAQPLWMFFGDEKTGWSESRATTQKWLAALRSVEEEAEKASSAGGSDVGGDTAASSQGGGSFTSIGTSKEQDPKNHSHGGGPNQQSSCASLAGPGERQYGLYQQPADSNTLQRHPIGTDSSSVVPEADDTHTDKDVEEGPAQLGVEPGEPEIVDMNDDDENTITGSAASKHWSTGSKVVLGLCSTIFAAAILNRLRTEE